MKLFQAAGTLGLRTFATPTSTLVTNAVSIGRQTTQVNFPAASVAYAMRAVLTEGSNLLYNPETPNTTSGTTLVEGQGQSVGILAAGTASAAGNVAITIGDLASVPGLPSVPLYMVVTGTLTDGTNPAVPGQFSYSGQFGGKPAYHAASGFVIEWETGISRWVLRSLTNADARWESASDVASPDLADWSGSAISPATGTPTVVTASHEFAATGFPVTIQAPILSGDTAAVWVTKAREALAANAIVAANFDVANTSTVLTITRKPRLLGGAELYAANNPALNISIANGTPSPGIAASLIGFPLVAGIATEGTIIFDGEGNDFEGNEITSCNILHGELIQNSGTETITMDLNKGGERIIPAGGAMLNLFPGDGFDVALGSGYEVTIENTGSDATVVDIVIIGQP